MSTAVATAPSTQHTSVMLNTVLELLQPQANHTYIDATFGGGGYTRALLEVGASVIGFDRDPRAIARGEALIQQFPDQLTLVESNNNKIKEICHAHGCRTVNGIVADLGLSSDQLNDPERGFTYQQDGPLDMRMGNEAARTAAEVLNRSSEPELADIFYYYGEERSSRKLARAVVEHRKREKFNSTAQFLDLIERVFPAIPGRTSKRHPAQRLFQALRIAVNNELDDLQTFLTDSLDLLAPNGTLVVVSFHSLEDRCVKQTFREAAQHGPYQLLTKKPLEPTEAEVAENIRARSAKTRAITKEGAA